MFLGYTGRILSRISQSKFSLNTFCILLEFFCVIFWNNIMDANGHTKKHTSVTHLYHWVGLHNLEDNDTFKSLLSSRETFYLIS